MVGLLVVVVCICVDRKLRAILAMFSKISVCDNGGKRIPPISANQHFTGHCKNVPG